MSQIIKLNVGGVRYETTWATLMLDPESMLARMIDQPNEKEKIKNGQKLFIDRDGAAFGYILNYLRSGDQVALPTDQKDVKLVLQECDFYQLRGLINLIKYGGSFQVGDMVGISTSGVKHLNLTYGSFPQWEKYAVFCCLACHNEIKFEFPICPNQWSMHDPETVMGKILEVNEGCAMVGFLYSCLRWSCYGLCTVTRDTIVQIHMPLMHLTKK